MRKLMRILEILGFVQSVESIRIDISILDFKIKTRESIMQSGLFYSSLLDEYETLCEQKIKLESKLKKKLGAESAVR